MIAALAGFFISVIKQLAACRGIDLGHLRWFKSEIASGEGVRCHLSLTVGDDMHPDSDNRLYRQYSHEE